MRPCEICGRPGQRHHIVFRSHGGLNIELNFAYLCADHHTGPQGVHNNRDMDLRLKIRMQRKLEQLFSGDGYQIGDIARMVGYDRRRLEKRIRAAAVPDHLGEYARWDIIRFFMGGKLYEELREYSGQNTAGLDGFTFICPRRLDETDGQGADGEDSGEISHGGSMGGVSESMDRDHAGIEAADVMDDQAMDEAVEAVELVGELFASLGTRRELHGLVFDENEKEIIKKLSEWAENSAFYKTLLQIGRIEEIEDYLKTWKAEHIMLMIIGKFNNAKDVAMGMCIISAIMPELNKAIEEGR